MSEADAQVTPNLPDESPRSEAPPPPASEPRASVAAASSMAAQKGSGLGPKRPGRRGNPEAAVIAMTFAVLRVDVVLVPTAIGHGEGPGDHPRVGIEIAPAHRGGSEIFRVIADAAAVQARATGSARGGIAMAATARSANGWTFQRTSR